MSSKRAKITSDNLSLDLTDAPRFMSNVVSDTTGIYKYYNNVIGKKVVDIAVNPASRSKKTHNSLFSNLTETTRDTSEVVNVTTGIYDYYTNILDTRSDDVAVQPVTKTRRSRKRVIT